MQDRLSGRVLSHQCLPGYCQKCDAIAEQGRYDALNRAYQTSVLSVEAATSVTAPPVYDNTTNGTTSDATVGYVTQLTSVVSSCTTNRQDAANNTLCGKCIEGFVEWVSA